MSVRLSNPNIEYKESHDKIEYYIHWKICKPYGILDRENVINFNQNE